MAYPLLPLTQSSPRWPIALGSAMGTPGEGKLVVLRRAQDERILSLRATTQGRPYIGNGLNEARLLRRCVSRNDEFSRSSLYGCG